MPPFRTNPNRVHLGETAMFRTPTFCVLVVASSLLVVAQEKAKKIVATEPAAAGPDFAVQGEYTGELPTDDGNKRFGIQVIALGDGKFDAVAYRGGLPGDGWDKSEKIRGSGETTDGVTVLKGDEGLAKISGGVLRIINKDGNEVGQLKKVERKSPTLGMKPPAGAVVLFDGSTADAFEGGRITPEKLLMEGVTSKRKVQSCTLHLEFMLPFQPSDRGQARGNSGCYLQGRYEVQILDSFGLEGKNNECGGLYSIKDCDLNMCLPPLAWQTYDIDYTAAKYDDAGKKLANGRMTVRHNGVVIHDNVELPKDTTAAPVKEGPAPGPIYLQNHGNPVRFRNIWLVEKP
jgi:hypothetical protein